MTIVIIANGKLERVDWVSSIIKHAQMVIAADGGANHLGSLGHVPNVIVGDMDSIDPGIRINYDAMGVDFITHPEDKDQTDLELALRYALAHTVGDIRVLGSMGGRIDQLLGNVLLLSNLKFKDRHIEIVEEDQRAWFIKNKTEIQGRSGDVVSLIPIRGDVFVVRTSGLRWPLENEYLKFGETRGISNQLVDSTGQITIKSGTLLCVHIKRNDRAER